MHNVIQNDISKQDLKKKLLGLLQEQLNMRLQLASGKLKKTHVIKKIRKDIARIKTVLTDRINDIS
ncbi:50S ribosomal protein L29 [Buchnera aphidicola (Cinara pseudotaxifoliae)]|uniref:Large ribosomal subunit protein uL29 n=1 Tax=Buchnera aphidicola (Cinara pseudotaxifoliae) TaxID=655384 RepID=A0A451DHQ2_9GAMM|nr:50S ribosomal protein L29 [Buchnera aphidicola]VFP86178.1 50S ribosomal protein L29 [Buchnera aphidicola (Cinara pseudotaxifoliae)]